MQVNKVKSSVAHAPAISNTPTASQATQADAKVPDVPPVVEAASPAPIRLNANHANILRFYYPLRMQISKFPKPVFNGLARYI
ncbi:MAG: hypothetical protein EBS66_18035 [Betaproteobacteria bacterium]|nr:hypothetical protein [Betaproteobacteria bacterium]